MPNTYLNSARLNQAADRAEAEAAQSADGPAFSQVTCDGLFGPRSDYQLAARVMRQNPSRYRELRKEWEYLNGSLTRPDSYYS